MRRLILAALLLGGCSGSKDTSDGGADASAAFADLSEAAMIDLETPPDLVPPFNSCVGLTYCDGFEAYSGAITNNMAVGPWKASVNGTGTVMQVDTVKPFSGTKSLHVTVPAGTQANGTLNQKATAGLIAGNDMYGRAMVYYSSDDGNALPNGVHSWTFNSQGTSSEAKGVASMNVASGGTNFFLNYHPPVGNEQSVSGGTLTAGVWHCVQWEYDGSGTPPKDEGKIWVDGALVVDAMPSKGWQFATPWDSFDFGFTHYQTLAKPVDIYLDDFALDGKMLECP